MQNDLVERLDQYRAVLAQASEDDLREFALGAMAFQYEALTKLMPLYEHADPDVAAQARKVGERVNDIYLAFHPMDDR